MSAQAGPVSGAQLPRRATELSLLLLLATLWGASYTFIKIGVETIPPLTLIAARTTLAGGLLLAVMRARRVVMPRDWNRWRSFLFQACLNSVIPFTLIAWAERSVDAVVRIVVAVGVLDREQLRLEEAAARLPLQAEVVGEPPQLGQGVLAGPVGVGDGEARSDGGAHVCPFFASRDGAVRLGRANSPATRSGSVHACKDTSPLAQAKHVKNLMNFHSSTLESFEM